MTKVNRITPEKIRQTNSHLIYRYIYDRKNKHVSQHDISHALRMSRPTVASNISAMEDEGLIFRSGIVESNLPGRNPVTWSVNAMYKIALGVEILKQSVKIIAIDLYGRSITRTQKATTAPSPKTSRSSSLT